MVMNDGEYVMGLGLNISVCVEVERGSFFYKRYDRKLGIFAILKEIRHKIHCQLQTKLQMLNIIDLKKCRVHRGPSTLDQIHYV